MKIKKNPRINLRLLAVALLSAVFIIGWESQARAEFYSFRARSTNTGGSVDSYKDSNGGFDIKTSHAVGVEITLASPNPPPKGYDIDWFFVAEGINTKKLWVSGGGEAHVGGKNFSTKVFSRPLVDEKNRSVSKSVDSVSNDSITIKTTIVDSAGGSKLLGWVTRLKRDGVVIQMQSSQGILETFAKENEQTLNAALPQLKIKEAADRLEAANARLLQRGADCRTPLDVIRMAGLDDTGVKDFNPPIYVQSVKQSKDGTQVGFTAPKVPGIIDKFPVSSKSYYLYCGESADFSGQRCAVTIYPGHPEVYLLIPDGEYETIEISDAQRWKKADDYYRRIASRKERPAGETNNPAARAAASLIQPQN